MAEAGDWGGLLRVIALLALACMLCFLLPWCKWAPAANAPTAVPSSDRLQLWNHQPQLTLPPSNGFCQVFLSQRWGKFTNTLENSTETTKTKAILHNPAVVFWSPLPPPQYFTKEQSRTTVRTAHSAVAMPSGLPAAQGTCCQSALIFSHILS